MGRRKIEIKAIKDDRNRSVTFLKRKGGLFKKAHELSVLCSVDVAVFIFGSNKKLYEYSSSDMRDLITRYTYHGGPNEHKGPADFNGGDDDDDEDGEATPPHGHEGSVEPGMIPPHFPAQHQPPFPHLRGHTASASPPINGVAFPRGHTPQPQMGSRPSSRTDFRRAPVGPQGGPSQPNGYAFMPHPIIYNSQNPAAMPPNMQHAMPPQPPPPPPTQYSYQHPQHPHSQHAQQHAQMQQQQQQHYLEEQRRASVTPSYPSHAPPPAQSIQRPQPSPPPPHPQQLPQPVPQMSPPQPQHHLEVPQPQHMAHHPQPEPQPPSQPQQQPLALLEPRPESAPDRPNQRLLDTSAAVKKLPPRKGHSIFTPIDESRSILSEHLQSFADPRNIKELSREDATRSHSVDVGAVQRDNETSSPPPPPQRSHTSNLAGSSNTSHGRNSVSSSVPETTFTPPSRSNSLRVGGAPRPKLKVQIPDEASEAGSNTQESTTSPRNPQDTASQAGNRRNGVETHGAGPVLPPPSPSASALLSAGATGPPNPFARPLPQSQNNNSSMNIDTPVSALPSRFLNNEFLPSPSSFYPEWNFRGNDSNTLPSPLNFATPVVGTGPSFLRDENPHKRKSPEISTAGPPSDGPEGTDAKRVRVDS